MERNSPGAEYRLTINGKAFRTDDRAISGRDILAIAAFRPASDFSIVTMANHGTQLIGLDEKVRLDSPDAGEYRIFKGDRVYRAVLNEREIVWGDEDISASDLRAIGEIAVDQELFLDSSGDRVIEDDEVVRLRKSGVERIRSGDPPDQAVNIVLNGDPIEVDKGRLSFSDLAKLAFPDLFGRELICFTVSFTRGPKRRPEGVLLEGDKVRVVEGMVFNVSATDKS